jgi:hypothetical protein
LTIAFFPKCDIIVNVKEMSKMECEKCNCKKLCDKLIASGVSGISCQELKKIIQEILDKEKEM